MKRGRGRPSAVAVPLLVAIAGAAGGWGSACQAQTAGAWSTVLAPINGTVRTESEDVLFTGQARINSKLAPDSSTKRPSLVLSIDLGQLSGVGSSTKAKYVITGPEMAQRQVASSHLVEFEFPFFKSGGSTISSVQSGVASFALYFDVATGAVTGASGHLTSGGPPR